MSLGEAFVEIRADLRPFGRDLKAGVKPMVEAFERELNNAVGRAVVASSQENGRRIGDGLSTGIKNSMDRKFADKNIFVAIAAALGSALDDGISALPTEVKAILVGSILAVSPLVAGALAAAVTAGLGAALAGIGVLLAFQFEAVQQRAVSFGRSLREQLAKAAGDFVPAVINAFDVIESRVGRMGSKLEEIFNVSSNFLEPLVQGGLDAVEALVDAILSSIDDIKPFVDDLGAAMFELGRAIGGALSILAATGEEGRAAFRTLIALVSGLIILISGLIFVLAKAFGAFRAVVGMVADIFGWLNPLFKALDTFFDTVDRNFNESKSFVNTNTDLANSFDSLISKTDAQVQELKKYSSAMEKLSDGVKDQLALNISWEESLDRITESLKENGKTLDIGTEKGRANAQEFLRALEIAEERTVKALQSGEISSEQAALQYDQQTEALRRMAVQAGIAEQDFNALFNEIIETGKIRISTEEMGLTAVTSELTGAGDRAQRLLELLHLIKHLSSTIGAGALGGVKGFSEGGIQYTPTVATLAEDGAEAIIPLTKPARAAQILEESGLSKMLGGGSGANTFMVFIGNEQLDSHVVRIVEGNNMKQALALSHGGRSF